MNKNYIIKNGVLTFLEQVTVVTPELINEISEAQLKQIDTVIVPPTVVDIKGGVMHRFESVNKIIVPNHFKKYL